MAARMGAYRLKQYRRRPPRPLRGVHLDRDVPVAMRDGVRLMTHVFRPRRTPGALTVTIPSHLNL
jgi:predicted acyl esterase